MLLVGARKIMSVLLSSSWISMERSVSQTSCTSATSLTSSGGDGTCSQLSMCSLVRFCSSVHCRPGFKLCPRKLQSIFVQLLPDLLHMQLLQSSNQFSPISLDLPSPSRHCESAPVLKPDMANGSSKLQPLFVQEMPPAMQPQLLQSSIQPSPSSLAVPLLSTQATGFSPNLPGEEATNDPVSSSSNWRTWQMTSPLSQEQSLWFPFTSTPEDLSSSSQTSCHSSHISRCSLWLPRSSTHSCSSLLTQNLKVQTGTPVEVHLQLLQSSFQESPTRLGFPSLSSPHWEGEVEATFTTLSVQEGEPLEQVHTFKSSPVFSSQVFPSEQVLPSSQNSRSLQILLVQPGTPLGRQRQLLQPSWLQESPTCLETPSRFTPHPPDPEDWGLALTVTASAPKRIAAVKFLKCISVPSSLAFRSKPVCLFACWRPWPLL